jgi:hypothetical protein
MAPCVGGRAFPPGVLKNAKHLVPTFLHESPGASGVWRGSTLGRLVFGEGLPSDAWCLERVYPRTPGVWRGSTLGRLMFGEGLPSDAWCLERVYPRTPGVWRGSTPSADAWCLERGPEPVYPLGRRSLSTQMKQDG